MTHGLSLSTDEACGSGHLAYRWFCRLDLEDKVPDHSSFSVNRHGRFRDTDIFRQLFEAAVRTRMDAGLHASDSR